MISVIIATYNRANMIDRAVESVLNQSYDDFEIVIVDDGSTDNTEEVIRQIHNNNIKYFQLSENKGQAFARNYGVEMAQGNFITFLDSDDYYYDKNVLSKIVLHTKDYDVISFSKYCIEKNGERFFEESKITGDAFEYLMQHPLHYIGKPPYAVNRKLFLDSNGFDTNLSWGEAIPFWRRLFATGAKLGIVNDIGYVVVVHSNSRVSTGGNRDRKTAKKSMHDAYLKAFRENPNYFENHKVIKSIWLILLFKTSKSMRNFYLMKNYFAEIIKNGLPEFFKAYLLLKSGEISEG